MSHPPWDLCLASRFCSIILIAFIIHKLLKLASGPRFPKPPGLSQLRLLCVRGCQGFPCGFESGSDAQPGAL